MYSAGIEEHLGGSATGAQQQQNVAGTSDAGGLRDAQRYAGGGYMAASNV